MHASAAYSGYDSGIQTSQKEVRSADNPPTATSSTNASPTPASSICETIKPVFADVFELPWATTDTTFTDIATGTKQQGCRLTAEGTGVQITDFVDASQRLATLLTNHDRGPAQPLADGPTGTVIGFNGGGRIGQLTVEWKPAPGVNCPQNQPIMDCTLLPEQKLYVIKLEAAASDAADSSVPAADDVLQQAVHTQVLVNTDVRTFTFVVDVLQATSRLYVSSHAGQAARH
jgi:hypothetical protein